MTVGDVLRDAEDITVSYTITNPTGAVESVPVQNTSSTSPQSNFTRDSHTPDVDRSIPSTLPTRSSRDDEGVVREGRTLLSQGKHRDALTFLTAQLEALSPSHPARSHLLTLRAQAAYGACCCSGGGCGVVLLS